MGRRGEDRRWMRSNRLCESSCWRSIKRWLILSGTAFGCLYAMLPDVERRKLAFSAIPCGYIRRAAGSAKSINTKPILIASPNSSLLRYPRSMPAPPRRRLQRRPRRPAPDGTRGYPAMHTLAVTQDTTFALLLGCSLVTCVVCVTALFPPWLLIVDREGHMYR